MDRRDLLMAIKAIIGVSEFASRFEDLKRMSDTELKNFIEYTPLTSRHHTPSMATAFIPTESGSIAIKGGSTVFNFKKEKTTMKEEIKSNVVSETLGNAKLQVGKLIYTNVTRVFKQFLPKFTWYERLFVSREKREIAELLAVYAILHVVRVKYDHYALECLTTYLNHEMQSTILAGIASPEVLSALFSAPEAK